MIEPAQIARIEAVERDAWLDIYAAAPPPMPVSEFRAVVSRIEDEIAKVMVGQTDIVRDVLPFRQASKRPCTSTPRSVAPPTAQLSSVPLA